MKIIIKTSTSLLGEFNCRQGEKYDVLPRWRRRGGGRGGDAVDVDKIADDMVT